jgi:hypothetical protein
MQCCLLTRQSPKFNSHNLHCLYVDVCNVNVDLMTDSLICLTMMAESVRARLCCHVGCKCKTFGNVWPEYAILQTVNVNSKVAFGQ